MSCGAPAWSAHRVGRGALLRDRVARLTKMNSAPPVITEVGLEIRKDGFETCGAGRAGARPYQKQRNPPPEPASLKNLQGFVSDAGYLLSPLGNKVNSETASTGR
jgi:hypothetical protein